MRDQLSPHQFGAPYFPGNDKTKASQGKLFRDPKPVDQHRYQRGYTPERMAEVRGMPLRVATEVGLMPKVSPLDERHVRETIARSTTPAKDVQSRFNGDALAVVVASHKVPSTAEGMFEQPRSGHHGVIHLRQGADTQQGSQTLLHELGHHRSFWSGNDSAEYKTPTQRGKEEAFADDNMVSRWRPDPRDVRRFPEARLHAPHPSYEYEDSFRGKGGKTAFAAYSKARRTPNAKEAESARHRAKNANASFQPELNLDETRGLNEAQFGRKPLF